MTPPDIEPYVRFYEALTPADLDRLGEVMAHDVVFRDPFNEAIGLDQTRRVFEHMFQTLAEARFEVTDRAWSGRAWFLKWTFHARTKPGAPAWKIQGMSEVEFGADGRVASHVDHWDAMSQILVDLPLLGPLVRLVRRKASALG
jgi:ketosteroid isomerase-like protein